MAVHTFAMAIAPLAPSIGEQLAAGLGKPSAVPAKPNLRPDAAGGTHAFL
jgi:hypothetical protein